MNIVIEHRGDVDVLRLPVRLMLANAPALRAAMLAHVESGARRIVLDLSAVEFADSSGLSAVLACVTAIRRAGGDIVLAAPSPRVRALIELTRLDEVLDVRGTVHEAIGHLSERAA